MSRNNQPHRVVLKLDRGNRSSHTQQAKDSIVGYNSKGTLMDKEFLIKRIKNYERKLCHSLQFDE
jgi:hypothetical protein